MSSEKEIYGLIDQELETRVVTIYDIEKLSEGKIADLNQSKKLLHKYSFTKGMKDLERYYQVQLKNLTYQICSQEDLVALIKSDKDSIIGAFLYAVIDPEHLSLEDWLFKSVESHFGESPIQFQHDASIYHQNSQTRRLAYQKKGGAPPPKQVMPPSKPKHTINMTKPQIQAPNKQTAKFQKQNDPVMKKDLPVGKLGFAAAPAKKKVDSPIKKKFVEEKTADIVMEPSSDFKNTPTKKKIQKQVNSDISDTQEAMQDMEITKPTRRNRKRNFIQESDDDELDVEEPAEIENMEVEKPTRLGAMDRFVTKSAETSQPNSQQIEALQARAAKKGMKRVLKERTFNDKNGYMVVEEYSSYEEAGPEDIKRQQQVSAQKPKGPTKKQNQVQSTLNMTKKPQAAIPAPAGTKKQGGIAGFFKKKQQV